MSTVEIESIPSRLKAVREQRGLTQTDLGHRAGIAAASISHFETGQRLPSLESLVRIADALDVSIDELLGRTTNTATANIDPVFLRASRAPSQTLDVVRTVTAALLAASEKSDKRK
jgi:transcriptional regulator with XRE-family HTH domain